MGIPIGKLLGFLSARGILEAATGFVSPELFLVQDASELKTLRAENSSLNGTLLVLSGAITLAFALFAALPAARSAARDVYKRQEWVLHLSRISFSCQPAAGAGPGRVCRLPEKL